MAKKKNQTKKNPAKSERKMSVPVIWDNHTREQHAHAKFQSGVKIIKSRSGEKAIAEIEHKDMSSVYLKRRVKAVAALADEVKERYGVKYKELCSPYTIDEDWILINVTMSSGYDYEEKYCTYSLAAAIWLLDYFKSHEKMEELDKVLPPSGSFLEEDVDIQGVWDPSHSWDMIFRMAGLIQNRNQTEKQEMERARSVSKMRRCHMTSAVATQKVDYSNPFRHAYDTVISMVDAETVAAARALYHEKFWDWTSRVFESHYIHIAEMNQLEVELKRLKEACEAITPSVDSLSPSTAFSAILDKNGAMLKIEAQRQSILNKSDKIEFLRAKILQNAWKFPVLKREKLVEFYGEDRVSIWDDFHFDDPYFFSFAFLVMLDENSNLPWCYQTGVSLMKCCSTYYPWVLDGEISLFADNDHDNEEDLVEDEDDCVEDEDDCVEDKNDEVCKINGSDDSYVSEEPDELSFPDLNNLQYLFECDEFKGWQKRSLSQIMYETTGCVLPRAPQKCSADLGVLRCYGLKEDGTLQAMMYCATLLNEMQARYSSVEGDVDEFSLDPMDDVPEVSVVAGNEEDDLALKEQNTKLQEEVRRLRAELCETKKDLREQKSSNSVLKRQVDMDAQELADLRGIVFRQNQGIQEKGEEKAEEATIQFPCKINQRVLAFGGHDSWLREIRQKLPDVRFVGTKHASPRGDIIQKADVIWIQSNALAHDWYNTVINIARKRNIPVRYFGFASATKCAEQVVQYDRECC